MNQIKRKILKYFKHLPFAYYYNRNIASFTKNMKFIGITGTDGKTTTSNMLYHILNECGAKVGMISTISAKIGDKDLDTGFHVTSPGPAQMNKYLKMMIDAKIEIVVLETTSHAIDQFRYLGIVFDVVVFTNITPEHLDYHATFEDYRNTKLKLIDNLKLGGTVIANSDDTSYEYICKKSKDNGIILKSYGKYNANLKICSFQSSHNGIIFELQSQSTQNFTVDIPILGEYNKYNATAALLASTCILTESISEISKVLKTFSNIEGRMEVLQKHNDNKPMIIVDFAHTPNALDNALKTTMDILPIDGVIHLVFGCAGARDRSKRPKMGVIASKYAKYIYLVPEDPRFEKVCDINDEISKDIVNKKDINLFRFDGEDINARKDGIKAAYTNAKSSDIILVTGKGHEKSLCFKDVEYNYSDQEIIQNLIK